MRDRLPASSASNSRGFHGICSGHLQMPLPITKKALTYLSKARSEAGWMLC